MKACWYIRKFREGWTFDPFFALYLVTSFSMFVLNILYGYFAGPINLKSPTTPT